MITLIVAPTFKTSAKTLKTADLISSIEAAQLILNRRKVDYKSQIWYRMWKNHLPFLILYAGVYIGELYTRSNRRPYQTLYDKMFHLPYDPPYWIKEEVLNKIVESHQAYLNIKGYEFDVPKFKGFYFPATQLKTHDPIYENFR
jgi:hypothetical protein